MAQQIPSRFAFFLRFAVESCWHPHCPYPAQPQLLSDISGGGNMHLDRIARNHAAAVSVLLALSFAAPIAAQTRNTSQPSALTGDLGTVRIDNFGRVAANYYRGAQPQGADYARLSALGIKSVINLTSDDADPSEQTMVEQAGMQYFQIPMTTHEAPTATNLEAFMRIVHDSASQPVRPLRRGTTSHRGDDRHLSDDRRRMDRRAGIRRDEAACSVRTSSIRSSSSSVYAYQARDRRQPPWRSRRRWHAGTDRFVREEVAPAPLRPGSSRRRRTG